MNCQNCNHTIPKNAKFCPQCGTKVENAIRECISCGKNNPHDAKRCYRCGHYFIVPRLINIDYQIIIDIKKHSDPEELKLLFFKGLRKRVGEEWGEARYSDYLQMFYESGFDKKLNLKIGQLSDEIFEQFETDGKRSLSNIESLIVNTFDDLTDYFLIQYSYPLNDVKLPEQILKYQQVKLPNLPIRDMIFDFLNLHEEKFKFYTEFITMPTQKLRNAADSFLKPAKDETIFLLCDTSFWGNFKEGFALTEFGVYWKPSIEKAHQVYYQDLETIIRHDNYIKINNAFFDTSKSLNIKMLYLLNRLKKVY